MLGHREIPAGEARRGRRQLTQGSRHRSGDHPADQGHRRQHHGGDRAESEPEVANPLVDVARVEGDPKRAVHRSPRRDRHRNVEQVGSERVRPARAGGPHPVECRLELGSGREVSIDVTAGVDLGDPIGIDHHDPGPGSVLVGVGRSRIERQPRFEVVLVQRRDHAGIVLDIGGEPFTFALGVEHPERNHQHDQHDHRDRQVAGQQTAGHGDVNSART